MHMEVYNTLMLTCSLLFVTLKKCLKKLIFGDRLHQAIFSSLKANKRLQMMFQKLFDPSLPENNLQQVINYILGIFSRLRGKDMVRSLMAKRRSKLKLHTRHNMAAAAIQAASKKENLLEARSNIHPGESEMSSPPKAIMNTHPDESEFSEHYEMLKLYEDSFDTIFDVE